MWKLASLITVALALVVPAHAQENVPEPEGYRADNYRAPVPATLAGARVLSTAEAEAIWRDKAAVFIDVLPRPPKPQGLLPKNVQSWILVGLAFVMVAIMWLTGGKKPPTPRPPRPTGCTSSRSPSAARTPAAGSSLPVVLTRPTCSVG